jgi:hypothetical protein
VAREAIRIPYPSTVATTNLPNSVSFSPWRRGGSLPSLVEKLHFSSFRVRDWWGSGQVVAAAPSPINSRFLCHLSCDIENFVGVVWSSRASSSCGDLWIVKELHRRFIVLLRLWEGCGLWGPFGDFPSATNNVGLALGGSTAAMHSRHGLEVEDEGRLKDFVVRF